MKLIHTADWHLGHRLREAERHGEHEAFLDWLLSIIEQREVDGLLLCGDIFDTVNPSAKAQEQWYRFLARCRRTSPELDIIVIGGNHDSAGRLDAPNPLLREMNVRVVGGLPRDGREARVEELLFPLRDRAGNVAAWVAAVPFLRTPDLPPVEAQDTLIAGVSALYEQVIDALREHAEADEAIIVMGHLYLAGTHLSELSERKVLGGNLHALPAEMFPKDVTYVALGHLHRAQPVGRENVRYSGSVIPLSIAERSYEHQVLEVELDGASLVGVEEIHVPTARTIIRIPDEGALSVAEIAAALESLPPKDGADGEPALIEVALRLERPEPGLRHDIEKVLETKNVRLLSVVVELTGRGGALADREVVDTLANLQPGEVFRRAWVESYGGEPPPEMVEAFHELVDQVMQDDVR